MAMLADTLPGETVPERNAREWAELEALGDKIAEGGGHLAAATAVWLGQIAEFDRRNGWWHPGGAVSCAQWLSWRCGLGDVAAREHVRVARALEDLPLLRAEFLAGRLSYSKVRAITRVANPANESSLVQTALCCTGAQLERITAGIRRAKDAADPDGRHERRRLTWRWDHDGMLVISGRFTPEEGALLLAGLDAARPDVSAETTGECTAVSTGPQVSADALVALARCTLNHLADVEPSTAPDHTVNIHVDLDELLADEPRAQIENGPAVHPETLRRLLCDSSAVVVAHHRAGRPGTSMDIGRRSRVVPRRLRRALILRDGGCGMPGCCATRFLHAHHVIHWSQRGPTALWNLILLCPAHHHLVHEGGFSVESDGRGGFVFRNPDGMVIDQVPPVVRGEAAAVPDMHRATIDSVTTRPHWHGEPLDLHYAVEVLLHAEERTARALADVSAETLEPPTGPSLN